MNVTQLIKKLQEIQKDYPRAKVLGEADTFTDGEYTHGLVNSAEVTMMTYNGSEGEHTVVVLSGH